MSTIAGVVIGMRWLLGLVGRSAEGLVPDDCLLEEIEDLVDVSITEFLPCDDRRMLMHETQESSP